MTKEVCESRTCALHRPNCGTPALQIPFHLFLLVDLRFDASCERYNTLVFNTKQRRQENCKVGVSLGRVHALHPQGLCISLLACRRPRIPQAANDILWTFLLQHSGYINPGKCNHTHQSSAAGQSTVNTNHVQAGKLSRSLLFIYSTSYNDNQ